MTARIECCKIRKTDDNLLDYGASGNYVVRLSRCIPNNAGFKLYFDNYLQFTKLTGFTGKKRNLMP